MKRFFFSNTYSILPIMCLYADYLGDLTGKESQAETPGLAPSPPSDLLPSLHIGQIPSETRVLDMIELVLCTAALGGQRAWGVGKGEKGISGRGKIQELIHSTFFSLQIYLIIFLLFIY
jgi:hypothetical protein